MLVSAAIMHTDAYVINSLVESCVLGIGFNSILASRNHLPFKDRSFSFFPGVQLDRLAYLHAVMMKNNFVVPLN